MKIREIDRKVMCALSRNIDLSIKELSEKMGMNYWTLYKTVEKLKNAGIIREVAIPNFKFLNYEIFVAGYGNLTKKRIHELWKLRDSGEFKEYSPLIFYGIAESYRGFVFGIAKNYTNVKKTIISAEKIIRLREIINSNEINLAFLPLELANIPVLFDYSGILCREIGMKNLRPLKVPDKKPRRNLTERDKIAMLNIVENPEVSLSDLAENIGVTIQTASKIKKRLFDEGWLIRRIIPNLQILGYEVMVFAHWHTNPKKAELMGEIKSNTQEFDVDISNITFLAYDVLEGIALAAFHTLKESREIISFFEKLGEGTGILASEPEIIFLSLQEGIKIKDHSYAGIIRDLLRS